MTATAKRPRVVPTQPKSKPIKRSTIATTAAAKDTPAKPYEVRSDKLPGLLLRVQPSGKRNYYVQIGRGNRRVLGDARLLTLSQAEQRARDILLDPEGTKTKTPTGLTLRTYLEDTYEPFVLARRKSAEDTVARIKSSWPSLLDKRIEDITAADVDVLRTKRLAAGKAKSTVNRDTAALSGLFAHYVKNNKGAVHPLHDLDALDQPDDKRVRFLTKDEEQRLRKALAERDAAGKAERERYNEWCRQRSQPTLPPITDYCDSLTPMTLLSLNTGMRRGEVFGLEWSAVNLPKRLITVTAATSKSDKTRVIPLNAEAFTVLTSTKPPAAQGLVFPSAVTGERMVSIKKAWAGVVEAAELEDFRWHDLRHTFASKLVQAGVGLYVVQSLLGHATSVMTLRYAHLAPDHLADAVAVLER